VLQGFVWIDYAGQSDFQLSKEFRLGVSSYVAGVPAGPVGPHLAAASLGYLNFAASLSLP
jgi:hypothetical protein